VSDKEVNSDKEVLQNIAKRIEEQIGGTGQRTQLSGGGDFVRDLRTANAERKYEGEDRSQHEGEIDRQLGEALDTIKAELDKPNGTLRNAMNNLLEKDKASDEMHRDGFKFAHSVIADEALTSLPKGQDSRPYMELLDKLNNAIETKEKRFEDYKEQAASKPADSEFERAQDNAIRGLHGVKNGISTEYDKIVPWVDGNESVIQNSLDSEIGREEGLIAGHQILASAAIEERDKLQGVSNTQEQSKTDDKILENAGKMVKEASDLKNEELKHLAEMAKKAYYSSQKPSPEISGADSSVAAQSNAAGRDQTRGRE